MILLGCEKSLCKLSQEAHFSVFTPQPLRTVGVLFSPMVSGWAGGRPVGRVGGGKKFVRAVSQKL